jgi:hypothetical protein
MSMVSRMFCCFALCTLITADAAAQGKKTETTKYPGIMVFRCPYEADCLPLTSPDRALGDGNPSNYALLADASAGVGLYRIMREGEGVPSGEMHYNPGPETNGFSVTLDFSEPVGEACMNPYGRCFPYVSQRVEVKTRMEISTNVLDSSGDPAANGLFSIPLYGSRTTRFWFNFEDPDPARATGWRVRFSSEEFQGATDIQVRRTDKCTWVFEAGPSDRAGVWGYEAPPGKRRAERVDYGLFEIPFKLTFTAYDAPIPGTTDTCLPRP